MSAAVEHIRALLADGVEVVAVRVSEPHLSLLASSGLLDHTPAVLGQLKDGDLAERMVVVTADGEYQSVIPSL